ncbi:MAG: succinyl-diaminopimelate desuccinylase [Zetaproteobacteria bacterium CG_4_9_14_3_um_filter_49_83]|nr:MAG: succinyl-diaminopimelate desuccinylase [Zetaproteobacteria bacterium CG1_02_49_23]PIQ33111.1 MAG: succinyl-diaminopimelate desuccinylase [Zetaproteobacteria bacterium CG17_big_fil_post_rev_8_21_14_2_50_50_13]PIV29153.1 MAG: succinyl-diaminopimelate desuccinylase [Zetaproteobacteria bacterium CG02_land_8_20_14_3_00_50_9]PIY55618.1 MAG: succinyl-diaminopimelate desuccinylase [Zetaproteobacteria bacterium CG_4_10_14_0_8_um_filter_49_80]PJA36426.1 MAG: succinyl-diaminopimelate desuccinylase
MTISYHALNIASELIRKVSITPDDGACQDYIEELLTPLGFERIRIDTGEVINSLYVRKGEREGTLAFAGHTDVVPTGPIDQWLHPPFAAVIEDGKLHGRGAQDMKGGIACWIEAIAKLRMNHTPLPSLQMLITSDEEGESVDGTIRMVEYMQTKQLLPDAAIVGEPSSSQRVGDTIRRGRRGVVQVKLHFTGRQGHSAYPQDADNAIHRAAPALLRIATFDWGKPADGFPATSCQITNINGGTGASNVIPGSCDVFLDIRYNPANDFHSIKKDIENACRDIPCQMQIDHVAQAFSTPDGPFLDQVCHAIHIETGLTTSKDTGGGTSDARFLAAVGIPVSELGLTNDTIHQINECVSIDELNILTSIYHSIIKNFEV